MVLGLLLAFLAQVECPCVANVCRLRAAEHALPDYALIVIVSCADFLAVSDALEQTGHAMDVFLRLCLFGLLLALAVDETTEEAILTCVTLVVGAFSHGVLLWFFEVAIFRVAESCILQDALVLSLIKGLVFNF